MNRMHVSTRTTDRDRGSLSVFAVVATLALIVIIGLVVDGGGKVQAQQRAQEAARQAARAGGQAIQASTAVRGQGATADVGAARSAAESYLISAGVAGTVSIQGGTTIIVDSTESYTPIFLSIIGVGPQSVSGHSEARIVRAVGGVAQ
jgi:Flp pilus assembly protein TadG